MSAIPVDLWNKQVATGLALRLPLHISHPTRDKFAFAIGSSTADGWAPGPLDTSEDQIQLAPLHAYSSSNLLWEALHLYLFKFPGLVYSVNDNEHGHGRGSVGASSAYVYERGGGEELRM